MSTRADIKLASERFAALQGRRVQRCDAAINVLFAVLVAIAAAMLLVHFGIREGLW